MTVSSTTNRNNYTGDGTVDTYSYTFKIFSNTDLLVTVRNTNNVETTLTLTTDYTVTGVGSTSGGTVVLVNASQAWLDGDGDLLTGYELSIRRVRPLTQITDIRNQGSFLPETHEDEFDKQIMIAQQQQDAIDRSVSLPESVDPADFDNKLPATIVGSGGVFLKTNASGDGFTFSEGSSADLSVPAGNGILAKTGTGSSEARTLTGTSNQITITNGDGISGDPTFSIASNAIFPGTEGVQVPQGTTAQRAGTPTNGELRYNSTLAVIEAYENSAWVPLRPIVPGTSNIGLAAATTTNANDSIKITGANGTAFSASNPGFVTLASTTSGALTTYKITADVTILLTGAHFGLGGGGDLTDQQLSVYALNNDGALVWGVAYNSDRLLVLNTEDQTTQTSVTSFSSVLVNSALSADAQALHVGWFKANFDDTGGAAEDLWSVQTGDGDINLGEAPLHVSEVWIYGGNGFGSTLTTIRRWSNSILNLGPDITYADNASNGATFTINTDGFYAINYSELASGGAVDMYILLNGTSNSIEEDRLSIINNDANDFSTASAVKHLKSGDVIRALASGTAPTNTDSSQFRVTRVK